MLRLSVCKWCTLLNTVLCEIHVRERSEEEEVKTSTQTYGPHQTVLPQWGLKRQHAVGIKYSVGITLPWLKVTVGNKRREQSREKCDVSTNKRFPAVETVLLFYFQFTIPTKFYFSFRHPVRFTLSRYNLRQIKFCSTEIFFSPSKWNLYPLLKHCAFVILLNHNYNVIIDNFRVIGVSFIFH